MRGTEQAGAVGRLTRTALVVAAVLMVSLSGCGRRGALQPPPDPSAPVVAPADSKGVIAKRPRKVPITPPHDSFILDPLL